MHYKVDFYISKLSLLNFHSTKKMKKQNKKTEKYTLGLSFKKFLTDVVYFER